MIVWIILISAILIYWIQYPSIDDKKSKYKNIFNHIKIPLIVVVIIIIVFITYNKKQIPAVDVDLGIIKF